MEVRERRPIHLLMRFSDKLFSQIKVIEAHQDVIGKHGIVWMGKIGKTLGHLKVAIANEQIKNGLPTFVFLVQYTSGAYEFHKATLLEVTHRLPPGVSKFVPHYYFDHGIDKIATLWLKLSKIEPIGPRLKNLRIQSSKMTAQKSLSKSTAGLLVIEEGIGIDNY